MSNTMRLTLLFNICVALINARCPEPSQLPLQYCSRKFMCARLYEDSHHVDNLSCGGTYRNIYNGETKRSVVSCGWNDRVSSLVVSEGCRLDVYRHPDFRGSHKQFTGKVPELHWWNNRISSWSCACEFSNEPLRCTPTEEYKEIVTCRNPSPGEAKCSHTIKRGLSFGTSVTRDGSISISAQASLAATFKKIFSVGLAISAMAGFSWSKADVSTFSTEQISMVTCYVPTNSAVTIRQVVGRCGDTTVYTNHYVCQ